MPKRVPVQESLALRSSVISTLMDCNGVVELPVGVEVSDVLTRAERQPEDATGMSSKELTQALKVHLC